MAYDNMHILPYLTVAVCEEYEYGLPELSTPGSHQAAINVSVRGRDSSEAGSPFPSTHGGKNSFPCSYRTLDSLLFQGQQENLFYL